MIAFKKGAPCLASPFERASSSESENAEIAENIQLVGLNQFVPEKQYIRISDEENLESFKTYNYNNKNEKEICKSQSHTSSYPRKRRKTAYRDCRDIGEDPLDPEDIEKEKQFIKNQYSFAPECELFDIVYVQSEKYNK